MATKEPKGKKGKDGGKQSAKKSEDSIADEEKKEDSIMNETETSPTLDNLESPRKVPSPEPVYEYTEPLSELIIESYVTTLYINKINVLHIHFYVPSRMYLRPSHFG